MKDLTNSPIERANILNNKMALQELFDLVGFTGVMYEGKYRYAKNKHLRATWMSPSKWKGCFSAARGLRSPTLNPLL
ncbi:hypothetical protein [Runella sp.]|uniref:hypothetical protein n=1 Tax=Runella sp. TaxID=1960881 RepID=UPI00301A1546